MRAKKLSALKNAMRRKRIIAIQLLVILLLLFPLTTLSTFTWFSLSRTPSVNDMQITVRSLDGISLSWEYGAKDWVQSLNFTDKYGDNSLLRPVTYSVNDDAFYAVKYDNSGRSIDDANRLYEDEICNRQDAYAFILKFTIFARADTGVKVALADSSQGSGTYLVGELCWDDDNIMHYDAGANAQTAVRFGFRISYLDEAGEDRGEKIFAAYEPFADTHVNGATGYIETFDFFEKSKPLLPREALYTQTTTTWQESFPVEEGKVVYDYGTFANTVDELFTLEKGDIARIDVLVWLEGQDVDCTNAIGQDAKLFANLAFAASTFIDDGTVE